MEIKKKYMEKMKDMKKENKKHRKTLLGIGMLVMVGVCFIASMLFVAIVMQPVVENEIITVEEVEVKREPTLITGDADPGDNSGFFYAMIYPHQASPGTAYASNLSNSSAYEYADCGNCSMTGETPHSTTFDIVVKVGITDEDGYNSSGWQMGWTWMLMTCADLSIGADTNMSEVHIGNSSTYAWNHYYLNNGGSGYTIVENEAFNITSAKYYVQRIV